MNIDKLAELHYDWTPYNFSANSPLLLSDPTGLDWYRKKDENGKTIFQWFEGSDDRSGDGWVNYGESYSDTWSSSDGSKGRYSLNKDGSFSVLTYDDSDLGYSIENRTYSNKTMFSCEINTKEGEFSVDKWLASMGNSPQTFYTLGWGPLGGQNNSGPILKPGDKIENTDVLQWLGISRGGDIKPNYLQFLQDTGNLYLMYPFLSGNSEQIKNTQVEQNLTDTITVWFLNDSIMNHDGNMQNDLMHIIRKDGKNIDTIYDEHPMHDLFMYEINKKGK